MKHLSKSICVSLGKFNEYYACDVWSVHKVTNGSIFTDSSFGDISLRAKNQGTHCLKLITQFVLLPCSHIKPNSTKTVLCKSCETFKINLRWVYETGVQDPATMISFCSPDATCSSRLNLGVSGDSVSNDRGSVGAELILIIWTQIVLLDWIQADSRLYGLHLDDSVCQQHSEVTLFFVLRTCTSYHRAKLHWSQRSFTRTCLDYFKACIWMMF